MSDNLLERLEVVEAELKELKEEKTTKTTKMGKPKVTRKPTEYNNFMSNFIKEKREELGSEFNHKVVFANGAAAWHESRKSKESKESEKESKEPEKKSK